jgi:inner membrane protein YidH
MESGPNTGSLLPNRLARDLTDLSNERTLLGYVRTALAFFVTGLALMRFFTEQFQIVVGEIFIPLGLVVAIIGVVRFVQVRRLIRKRW